MGFESLWVDKSGNERIRGILQMTNRFTKSKRKKIVKVLLSRDGNICEYCKKPLINLDKVEHKIDQLMEAVLRERKTDIDHIDGNSENNELTNLRLLHHGCNREAYLEGLKEYMKSRAISSAGMSKREKKEGASSLAYGMRPEDGFAPNKNAEVEPIFRKWVFTMILQHKGRSYLTQTNLVKDGSEMVGASPKTVYVYMSRLTAVIFGSLEFTLNHEGVKILQFKREEDYSLNVDQLTDAYPWSGQRFAKVVYPEGEGEGVKKEIEES